MPYGRRMVLALVLRGLAILLLVLAVADRPWPSEGEVARVVVLLDRSSSIAAGPAQAALRETVAAIDASGGSVAGEVIEFTDGPGAASPGTTDIEAAIDSVLRGRNAQESTAIVVLSDGQATRGDTRRALVAAGEAGVPVLWRTLPPDAATPRIVAVHAPAQALPGQVIPVEIRLAGATNVPLALTLAPRTSGGADRAEIAIEAGALDDVRLRPRALEAGSVVFDLALRDPAQDRVIDAWPAAVAVTITAGGDILYVGSGSRPLARSLAGGGWNVEQTDPSRLDALAAGFATHEVVILDDVSATSASAATWSALGDAVRERGTGLLVLGGPRSFAAGGYRDSKLESLLPVLSRPAGLGDGAAIVFVVDKSGSMGEGPTGVDRFGLAQRAVIETAATLGERDSAALVLFDVEARLALQMQGAAQFRGAVTRPWPAGARGGTKLAPALDAALASLEDTDATRRLLVLVTDGFVDAAPAEPLRARLAASGAELVAIGVGADADTDALRRYFPADRTTLLSVAEAAELPAVMREGLESRRAPVERGRIEVRATRPLPFVAPPPRDWPPVAAYAVTTTVPGSIVHLESGRGDPLLAQRQVGLGRVVAVTPGLGAWTPDWLRWERWPEFAGGLVDWVAARDSGDSLWARATDDAGTLRVEVDVAGDGRWSAVDEGTLRVVDPSGRSRDLPLVATAPGRMTAEIAEPEDGLYSLTALVAGEVQRVEHLRRPRRERAGTEPSAEIAQWRAEGLVREWSPAGLATVLDGLPPAGRAPQRALLLALALFLLALVVERNRGHSPI